MSNITIKAIYTTVCGPVILMLGIAKLGYETIIMVSNYTKHCFVRVRFDIFIGW